MKTDEQKIAEEQVAAGHVRRAVADAVNGNWAVRPDKAFNTDPNVTVEEILRRNGWCDPDPDEHDAWVDVLGYNLVSPDGQGVIVADPLVLKESAAGLEAGTHTKTDLLRVLEHGGDLKKTLRHLRDSGYGRSADPVVLPSPSSPANVAEEILDGTKDERTRLVTLRFWRERWWRWVGPHYVETGASDVRAMLWRVTAHAVRIDTEDEAGDSVPWSPNRDRISNVYDALKAFTAIPSEVEPGDCVEEFGCLPAGGFVIPMKNGILHVSDRDERTLLPHTPAHFNLNSIPYAYKADAVEPVEWLKFLGSVANDDDIASLQEWFGYLVSGDTGLQKASILRGPARCGKGTIIRAGERLVGKHNTFATTAGSMVTKHGLAGALGKSLAVLGDAFFGKDTARFVELFKGITGEDTVEVEEKYKTSISTRLGIRFMIAMNQDPTFTDASAAVVERFVDSCVIEFHESFAGREDLDLGRRLAVEAPEIFVWALDGLARLNSRRRERSEVDGSTAIFTTSKNTTAFLDRLERRAAPVRSFLLERCQTGTGPKDYIAVANLEAMYAVWAEEHDFRVMDDRAFGTALATAYQSLGWKVDREQKQLGSGDNRTRFYVYRGIVVKTKK